MATNINVMEDRRVNIFDRRSHEERRETERSKLALGVTASGSFVEMAGGIGACVLAIIGLTGFIPGLMMAIATITIGASLFLKGLATTAGYSRIFQQASSSAQPVDFSGGLSAEIVAGIAGTVLGILALLNISPTILLPCAVITLGAGLFFSSGANARLNELRMGHQPNPRYERVMQEAVKTTAGAQMLVGLAVSVLGILALIGTSPVLLTLVAILCLGATELLSGSAVGGKLLAMVKSHA